MHDIEHQITYPGSNFIFHDSRGFEVGATEEMNIVMKFIEERAAETKLKDQLHAIWYLCSSSLHYCMTKLLKGIAYQHQVLALLQMKNSSSLAKQ